MAAGEESRLFQCLLHFFFGVEGSLGHFDWCLGGVSVVSGACVFVFDFTLVAACLACPMLLLVGFDFTSVLRVSEMEADGRDVWTLTDSTVD